MSSLKTAGLAIAGEAAPEKTTAHTIRDLLLDVLYLGTFGVGRLIALPGYTYTHGDLVRGAGALFLAALILVSGSGPAAAFPPYRSTDAGTADPWALEPRLGLFRIDREGSETKILSPLLRANLGLPRDMEAIAEFQYRADEEEVDDAAAGLKWVPLRGTVSAGIEALTLLPNAEGNGPGVEALFLLTLGRHALRLHVNAGGFHDPRPDAAESGWRTSSLAELQVGALRPGLEVFAKDSNEGETQLFAGPGIIAKARAFDVRAGFHVGISDAAPDMSTSLWLTTVLPLR